jgi:catechol 2,3-dioxygenase-like lactoylglutathione lyase family enzyme
MIAHTSILTRNYTKAKKLYSAALAPLGYKLTTDYPKFKAAGFKQGGQTDFWIAQPKRFAPMHIAFIAKSKKAVQDFYTAALKAGAKDNGAPGFRTAYGPTYYAAFVHDADGNNIEACYFGARAPKK